MQCHIPAEYQDPVTLWCSVIFQQNIRIQLPCDAVSYSSRISGSSYPVMQCHIPAEYQDPVTLWCSVISQQNIRIQLPCDAVSYPSRILGSSYPVMQCHIPAEYQDPVTLWCSVISQQNPLLCCCQKLRTHKIFLSEWKLCFVWNFVGVHWYFLLKLSSLK